MSSRMQPALLGGLLIGVLSALPFVSTFNACCCLWVVLGGLLTTYLLQERQAVPVQASEAAIAGLLAGVVGAMISTVVGETIALVRGTNAVEAVNELLGRGDIPPEMAAALERFRDIPPLLFVAASFVMTLVIFPIFAALGALLGVALFRRNAPPPGTVEVLPPEPS